MSIQSEQAVIGCILIDNNSLKICYHDLKIEMFSNKVLGFVYKRMLALYDNNRKINAPELITVCKNQQLDDNQIAGIIAECVKNTISSSEIKSHVENIISDYRVKVLKGLLQKKLDELYPATVNEILGDIITTVTELSTNETISGMKTSDMVDLYAKKKFKERKVEKVKTGIKGLDNLLGGLDPGDVVVIGARPAVGKSALVTQIAANMAKQKKKIGYFNLEMTEEQVYDRLVSFESGIHHERIRNAIAFLGEEEERFIKANEVLKSYNMEIFSGKSKISDIRVSAKNLGFDIIIIDYLQLIKTERENGNRATEVGYISKAIKELALSLNIPVILLSQLNRVSEGRDTKEPTMAELRESGDIEQDASVIILMWNLTEDRIKKGCKVDKNRNGKFGKISLEFRGEVMRFVEDGADIKDYEWKQESFTTVNKEEVPDFT